MSFLLCKNKNIERSDDMKLSVLTSSYKIRGHNNNKLIENKVNKNTILKGYFSLKNGVDGSVIEHLGGDG